MSRIGPEQVVAFGHRLRDVLASRETPTRKAWLAALLDRAEVDER